MSVKQVYKRLKLELLQNIGGAAPTLAQSFEEVCRKSDDSPSKCLRIESSIIKSESIVLGYISITKIASFSDAKNPNFQVKQVRKLKFQVKLKFGNVFCFKRENKKKTKKSESLLGKGNLGLYREFRYMNLGGGFFNFFF